MQRVCGSARDYSRSLTEIDMLRRLSEVAQAVELYYPPGMHWLLGNEATVAGTYGDIRPVTYPKGQLIALDPAGQLYAAIGAGNLRLISAVQESGGGFGTSN